MLDLEDRLARMRAAWTAGRSAMEHCPQDWRAAIGEGAQAEAALTALAGHAVQAVFRPAPPGALTPRPLLPRLPAPLPNPAARSRLRRLLAGKADAGRVRALVQLTAARGYVLHPADWTPGPGDDWAPAVYAPWLAWAAAERAAPSHGEALTVASYDDWPWAERRTELMALRRRDPAAALAIVSAKATAEPADRRLKLVESLEPRLSAADVPFLESLGGDRSDRVQAEARRLLARLGHGAGDAALAAELAAMVEWGRVGLIRRRGRLHLRPLKTQAQQKRRNELLALVALPDLARALDVSEPDLLESAPEGEPLAVQAFVGQVAETGSDSACRVLVDQFLEIGPARLDLAVRLSARLPSAERAARLGTVIGQEPQSFFNGALAFADDALGAAPARALAASPGYRLLLAALRNARNGDDQARAGADAQLRIGLANLGLLMDVQGARTVIDACVAAGLSAADPRLDLLHLNAALTPERPT